MPYVGGFEHGGDRMLAHGSVAQRLLASGMNIASLRTLDLLRKDEWIELDTQVSREVRRRLRLALLLAGRGLTRPIPNAMGRTMFEWQAMSQPGTAQHTMDGLVRGRNDAPDFDLRGVPLPLAAEDFSIALRKLSESRNLGDPLDVEQAVEAGANVAELIETSIVSGIPSIVTGGRQVYGLTNHPDRNTGQLVAAAAAPNGRAWSAAEKTGSEILVDVRAMMQAAFDDFFFGPFVLLIPPTYESRMADDFKAESDRTIRERILAIDAIEDMLVADFLPTDNVVLVALDRRVIDMLDGVQPTSVQWEVEGGFLINFKVFAIQIPRIKSTHALRSGVVHYTV